MATDPKANTLKRKQDLKSGFGLERCSNADCSQVLYEKSQAYWNHAPRKMICSKCESEVIFQGTDFAGNSMDLIVYIYWCDSCKEDYFLTIPMSRKFCNVCKVERYRSRSYHLRAPLPPHDVENSCIALNKEHTAA